MNLTGDELALTLRILGNLRGTRTKCFLGMRRKKKKDVVLDIKRTMYFAICYFVFNRIGHHPH
jgi:hypothetical protein